MKTVGTRVEQSIQAEASGELLAQGARFIESLAHLAPTIGIPKGVYRYASHEEANRHAEECLAQAMARLARQRAP